MPSRDERSIRVDLGRQRLALFEGRRLLGEWPVSTASNGPGEQIDSGCTPRGEHRVRIKIGGGCPPNTVFVGRRPTGEVYSERLAEKHPGRDWILTRIIWLTGAETGRNRGPGCDTLRRYIYIHGCPDSAAIGIVGSHGCIRMRNADLIELFEQVHRGTRVLISDGDTGANA